MAPGNPLWMQWVTEKAEEDEERGMESANAFYKAAKAFEMCPTPFHHPEEAIVLQNVGPKTIALIVKRLRAHCDEEGEDFPERVKKGAGKPAAAAKSKTNAKGKETKKGREEREDAEDAIKAARRSRALGIPLENAPPPAPIPYNNHLGPGPAPKRPVFPDDSDEEAEPLEGPIPKKRKVSTKTYVPKMRSGAYGILVGLYLCAEDDPSAWSTKEEIISMGQQHSDTSFTEVEKNRSGGAGARGGRGGGDAGRGQGGHASFGFSGWSNMTGLVNKDLVIKNGKRPLAFSLTTAGYEIAEKLAKVAGMNDNPEPVRARAQGSNSGGQRLGGGAAGRFDHDDEDDIPRQAAGRSNAHKDLPTDEDDFERQLAQALEMSRRESEGSSARPKTIAERTASAAEKRSMARTISSDGPLRSDQLDGRKAASGAYAKNANGESSNAGTISALGEKRFDYYYLDESENRVLDRYSAETKQEEGPSGAQMARVEYRTRQDLHPMARSVFDKERFVRDPALEGGDTKSGFMRYRSCAETAPGFSEDVAPPKVVLDSMASLMGNFKAGEKGKKSIYEAPEGVRRSGADGFVEERRAEKGKAKVTNDYAEAMKVTAPRPAAGPSSDKLAPLALDKGPRVNRHPLNTVRDHQSSTKYRFDPFEPITWAAGSFEVILLVDTREIGGSRVGGAGQRTSFVARLEDIGVACEVRMLPLGDMIWIARRTGRDGETEEIVLDAIVERKRLDDLCSSIKDGRYTDQKIRMNNSALNNRVYVIEKYDTEAQYSQFGQQIWTAKTRIQVNDGFFVYESKNIDSTINYLKNRTTVMKELYESSPLIAIPDRMIERASYLALQQHLRSTKPASKFHTTYASFAALNKSDAAITLTMQWGTMVQRVSGYSAEKAVQLLKYWPTPKALFDSLNKRRLESEEEDDMEGIGGGKGKGKAKKRKPQDFIAETVASGLDRDIKGKLSERMYELFMNKSY